MKLPTIPKILEHLEWEIRENDAYFKYKPLFDELYRLIEDGKIMSIKKVIN